MFTDIVGYTKLMGQDEDKAFEVLKKNQEIHNELIEQFNGTLIKEMGDGMLVSFDLASDAVRCAIKIQNTSKEQGIPLKIGIHQGEVVFADADVLGDGVNIASRLQENADAGSIIISGRVNSDVKNKAGIYTKFVEEGTFKNVDESIKIYQVMGEEEQPETGAEKKRNVVKKYMYYMLGGVIIVLTVLLISNYLPQSSSPSEIDQPITIAVLAFNDQSPDGDLEWLGDGVADEILNVLSKVNGLTVIGKTSSFSFKGKKITTKEIGESLGVSTILEGSVSKVEGTYRFTAQLINVRTDSHLWSEKYDRETTDIFAFVDEIAQKIAGGLMAELSGEEVKNIKMEFRPDPNAYEYFIKGEHVHYNEFFSSGGSSELFERAKDMYIRALSIEPKYGEALAGLAHLYHNYFDFGFKKIILIQSRDSILNIAYRVNPNSSYVLMMKGYLSTNYDSAFHFLTAAYSNDPNHLPIQLGIVNKLYDIGLYHESIAFCKKILKTDPLNKFIRGSLILNLWAIGQTNELREQVKDLLEFDKNNWVANFWMFYVSLLVDQDINEANRIYNHLNVEHPEGSNKVLKAWLLASEGRNDDILEEASNINERLGAGYIYAALDNKQALYLLDSLNNSAINKYILPLTYLDLKNNLIFNKLKDEPQFQQWIKEAKVIHEERVRKYGHLFDD